MKFLATLLWAPLAALAATTLLPGTYTVPSCPLIPPACPAPNTWVNGVCTPPVTPPPAGAFWIYQNGQFNFAADYSFQATIDYHNTTAEPGKTCIAVTIVGAHGGFQPYAADKKFDVSGYRYLTYRIKPTVPNQIIATGFAAINDVPDGPQQGVVVVAPGSTKYGPAPVVGQWATYIVPLADFGLTNLLIQKLTVADGTGLASNRYYIDSMGFLP
jgi:hypothetical protein